MKGKEKVHCQSWNLLQTAWSEESLETPEGFDVVELESINYQIPKMLCKGREGPTDEQLYFKRESYYKQHFLDLAMTKIFETG